MPVIEVDRLHKRYGDTVAVDEVSFTVEDGEIFGILGPNGGGKTTTVECTEGLRRPDDGTVRVLDLDPRRHRRQLRQVLGPRRRPRTRGSRPTTVPSSTKADLYDRAKQLGVAGRSRMTKELAEAIAKEQE